MPRIEYDVVFNIPKSSLGTVGDQAKKNTKEINKTKQAVENFNNEVGSVEVVGQKASQSIKTYGLASQKAFNSAGNAAQSYANKQEKVNRQVGAGNKQFASANQLVFSFSDGVQDAAQFSQGFGAGMRAIGNNISFTAELLGVTAKQAKEAGVSMKTALAGAITPVTAGILALNVGLTVGQFIWNEWGKEAKEAVNTTRDAVKSFISESASLTGDGAFDFLGIRRMRDEVDIIRGIEDEIVSLNTEMDKLSELNKGFLNSLLAFKSAGEITLTIWRQLNGSVAEQSDLISNLEEEYGITKEAASFFADELEDINNKLEIKEALLRKNPLARLRVWIEEFTANELSEFNTGLNRSNENLRRLAGDFQQTIFQLRAGDQDILSSLGISEDEIRPTIEILQEQLGRLSDFVPDRPTVANIIPTDDIIDNVGELSIFIDNAWDGVEDGTTFLNQVQADSFEMFKESAKKDAEELEQVLKQTSKSATQVRLDNLRTEARQFKRNMRSQADMERAFQSTRVNLYQSSTRAITSIQSGLLGQNKALALTLLAIEKGLAISQVAMDGTKNAAQATAHGNRLLAQSVTPLGPNPIAAAGAANAFAQAGKIKGMTAANIALIAATGLGEAAGIIGGGGDSGGGGGGSSSGGSVDSGSMAFINREGDVEPPSFSPRNNNQSQVNVTVVGEVNKKGMAFAVREGEREIRTSRIGVS